MPAFLQSPDSNCCLSEPLTWALDSGLPSFQIPGCHCFWVGAPWWVSNLGISPTSLSPRSGSPHPCSARPDTDPIPTSPAQSPSAAPQWPPGGSPNSSRSQQGPVRSACPPAPSPGGPIPSTLITLLCTYCSLETLPTFLGLAALARVRPHPWRSPLAPAQGRPSHPLQLQGLRGSRAQVP